MFFPFFLCGYNMEKLIIDLLTKSDPMALPYLIICVAIIILTYKVLLKFGMPLVAAHQKAADAIAGMKDVLSSFIREDKKHKEDVITKLDCIDRKLDDLGYEPTRISGRTG